MAASGKHIRQSLRPLNPLPAEVKHSSADTQCLCSRVLVVDTPEPAEAALVQVVRYWTDPTQTTLERLFDLVLQTKSQSSSARFSGQFSAVFQLHHSTTGPRKSVCGLARQPAATVQLILQSARVQSQSTIQNFREVQPARLGRWRQDL